MSRKDKLRTNVGPAHPSYRSVAGEIESLNAFILNKRRNAPQNERGIEVSPAEMLRTFDKVLASDIAEFDKREEELLALSQTEGKLAKELENDFLMSSSLKAARDRAQHRYDVVLERLQEINLTHSYSGFSTDLILSPTAAQNSIWPSKTKIAAVGLLGGLGFGLVLALIAELTDRTFRDPTDVETLTGASIFAHVDKLKTRSKPGHRMQVSPAIACFHEPHGPHAETFRVLRTSVMFLGKKNKSQVLMVTSPCPGDGKSTTISNLAVSLAQAGKRVLLVDADLRRPTLSSNFALASQSAGLTDFILGARDFTCCLHSTEQENLRLCPNGSRTPEPAELLESSGFEEFLLAARESFDFVLIDCPPLLAVADPIIIVDQVDACLLVMRVERNNRPLVERACNILREHDTKIDGIVVNSSRTSRGFGYKAYNFHGKHGYGYLRDYQRYYASQPDVADKPSGRNNSRTSSAVASSRGSNGQFVKKTDKSSVAGNLQTDSLPTPKVGRLTRS